MEFDPAKDIANVEKHGVSLARTAELDVLAFVEDTRPEDGERRFRLYGLLDGQPHCAVVTFRAEAIRAISLRKANRTERKRHGL
ncbi:MAG TPA: BrnT family toxin [Allosphingosinicella sp.]|jgi:hypothetical protein